MRCLARLPSRAPRAFAQGSATPSPPPQVFIDGGRLLAEALAELQGQLAALEPAPRAEPCDALKRVLEEVRVWLTACRPVTPCPAAVGSPAAHPPQAHSPALEAFLRSGAAPSAEAAAARPGLAAAIDENLRLLVVVHAEMAAAAARVAAAHAELAAAAATEGPRARPEGGDAELGKEEVDISVAAAAAADGVEADLDMVVSRLRPPSFSSLPLLPLTASAVSLQARIVATTALGTPAEEVGSFAKLARLQPRLPDVLVEEVLSWRRPEAVAAATSS